MELVQKGKVKQNKSNMELVQKGKVKLHEFIVHGIWFVFIRHGLHLHHCQSSPGPTTSRRLNRRRGWVPVVLPLLIFVRFKKFVPFFPKEAKEFLVPFHQVDFPQTARIEGVPGRIYRSLGPL